MNFVIFCYCRIISNTSNGGNEMYHEKTYQLNNPIRNFQRCSINECNWLGMNHLDDTQISL